MGADFVIAIDLNSDKSHRAVRRQENESKAKKAKRAKEAELKKEELKEMEQENEKNTFAQLLTHSKEYLQQFSEKEEVDKAPGVFAVMSGCIDIMQDRITRSRLAGDPPDVVLQPKVGEYGIMEFHRADEIIAEGERCVQASKSMLEYELAHFSQKEEFEEEV